MATIYHNPRCSKSRQALALLQEKGVEPDIILYLANPPDSKTLLSLLEKLGMSPRALLRKGEEPYRSLGLDNEAITDDQLIEAMCQHPCLIERPIVVHGNRAILGRPPEKVLELL